MNLEQITFRVNIEVNIEEKHSSIFVHIIPTGLGEFTVKLCDIEMSPDEFEGFVGQLNEINDNMIHIKELAERIENA